LRLRRQSLETARPESPSCVTNLLPSLSGSSDSSVFMCFLIK
jgi:hypothetical protein